MNSIKGDWFRTLQDDFILIGGEINDDKIVSYSKEQYKKYKKIQTSAFRYSSQLKLKSTKKLNYDQYSSFSIQPYLTSEEFS